MYHDDLIGYKPFHKNNRNAEAHRIAELEEARGQLLGILEAEGHVVAAFGWGEIALPLDLREKLEPLVGKTVAILRLNGYHIREVVGSGGRVD